MEQSVKQEPQELRCIDDGEESKSSAEQCTDASMVDRQPQSLIMNELPLQELHAPHRVAIISDQSSD